MPNKKIWANKNVLITGHTGFKGSWLCLWLNQLGAHVNGLSLSEPVSDPNMFTILELDKLTKDFRGDVTSFKECSNIVQKVKPEIIFHMAAQPLVRESYSDPLATYNTNIIGTANILEAANLSEHVKIIVVVTTDKCYENIEKDYAYVETDSLGGYDPYSSSKACAEHIASAYYRSFFKDKKVGLATVRAGNVIGGGDWSIDRLIPDAINRWSQDKTLNLRYPNATRPWQHVLEPLSGYLILAEKLWNNPLEFSEAWNFGPDVNNVKTVYDVVELSAHYWSSTAQWESSTDNHLHEAGLLKLNSSKAKSFLGWKPIMNFDISVAETISWYNEFYFGKKDILQLSLDQISQYEGKIEHG